MLEQKLVGSHNVNPEHGPLDSLGASDLEGPVFVLNNVSNDFMAVVRGEGEDFVDGAGWHQTGGKLQLPDNISLLHLPPYSPELNPVENIWQFLRQNFLSNRVFDSYEAIVAACCDAWNRLIEEPDQVRSITSRDYAKTVIA